MNDAHYENMAATLAQRQAEAEEASTEQRTAAERVADAVDDAENAPSGDYQTYCSMSSTGFATKLVTSQRKPARSKQSAHAT